MGVFRTHQARKTASGTCSTPTSPPLAARPHAARTHRASRDPGVVCMLSFYKFGRVLQCPVCQSVSRENSDGKSLFPSLSLERCRVTQTDTGRGGWIDRPWELGRGLRKREPGNGERETVGFGRKMLDDGFLDEGWVVVGLLDLGVTTPMGFKKPSVPVGDEPCPQAGVVQSGVVQSSCGAKFPFCQHGSYISDGLSDEAPRRQLHNVPAGT